MSPKCDRPWYRRLNLRNKPGLCHARARLRTLLVLEELEARDVPASLLPNGNYFEVAITNDTMKNAGGGQPSDKLWVSLVSQTQAYTFTPYQDAGGKTVYVATVDPAPGKSVASKQLSSLINQIDGTLGFYVQVFDGSPIEIKGGRIYFADQENAVPYSNGPGGIDPNAEFDFDFVEFTVDAATKQLNLDTTQVDQFGMPIYLQVDPVVPDFAEGTGIVATQTRANVIQQFKDYTAAGSSFTAYQGVYTAATEDRLLAPHHVIDANPTAVSTKGLREAFDQALYDFFNYYHDGTGGHHLYLVGNGSFGPEIFDGQVITNFQALDTSGNTKGTYTVFQFTGTGYTYDGTTNTLSEAKTKPTGVPNPNHYYGGAAYQIFYPYFRNNEANTFNAGLSSGSLPPQWFDGKTGNLPLTSAGRMAFGASGVFADDVQQKAYYEANPPSPANPNFDHVMLGNLENQLVTMVNRGVTPKTGSAATPSNLHLRTGSYSANDLIHVDLAQAQEAFTTRLAPDLSLSQGAATVYTPEQLLSAATDAVLWNTLKGTIYFKDTEIQVFEAQPTDITQPFGVSPPTGSPANKVTRANFVIVNGAVTQVEFVWESPVDIPAGATIAFAFEHGPATTEAHYATLHLFSPYDPALSPRAPTSFTNYHTGDLGPMSNFSHGLSGAGSPTNPTSGMAMSGVGLSNPTYVYQASAENPDSIIIYSPQALLGVNTNVLTFASFYPVDAAHTPIGQWNAYAAFFHIGDPAHGVPPPTVDGRGYAFAFDDNGGYSSDITVNLPSSNSGNAAVVTTLNLDLLPWETKSTYAVGADAGGGPHVKVFHPDGTLRASFFAYDPMFTGGVRVASGDVNNDGYLDTITAPGPGGGPHVKVFDGQTGEVLSSFLAYDPAFSGGVFVAAGDVNDDGYDDLVTGAGAGGGPHVKVFSGLDGSVLQSFFAYSPAFLGGVTVAAADVNGDGFADLVTGAGPGGGPHVQVFDGSTGAVIQSFFAYAAAYRGGVFVSVGNVRGDGRPEIVTGTGAEDAPALREGPTVRSFDAATAELLASFFAYDATSLGGVRSGVFDVDGDGTDEIITASGPGGGPHVKVFDGGSLLELDTFFAFDSLFAGGVFVAGT